MYRTTIATLPNQLTVEVLFEVDGTPDIFTAKASSLFPRQDLLPDSKTPVEAFDAHVLDVGKYHFVFLPTILVAVGGSFGWLYYDETHNAYVQVIP